MLKQTIAPNTPLKHPLFKKLMLHIQPEMFLDASHDFSHCIRVAHNAITIAKQEGGDTNILIAAALLHDIGNLPKNHPQRSLSSELSAKQAKPILEAIDFPSEKMDIVFDCIVCHSFSRNLIPKTKNGKIFQDADRLDALGSIGIARAFTTGAVFNNKLYASVDPFCKTERKPNDKNNILDHFFVKLFKIPEKMQTKTGKFLAKQRLANMHHFLQALETEIPE